MCTKGKTDLEAIPDDELWEIKTSPLKGCGRSSVWENSCELYQEVILFWAGLSRESPIIAMIFNYLTEQCRIYVPSHFLMYLMFPQRLGEEKLYIKCHRK